MTREDQINAVMLACASSLPVQPEALPTIRKFVGCALGFADDQLRAKVERLTAELAEAKHQIAEYEQEELRVAENNYKAGYQAALRSQQAAVPAWQPIETAPKGLAWVMLGYWPDYMPGKQQGGHPEIAYWSNGWINSCGTKLNAGETFSPTHWMPLPAAPGEAPQPSQQAVVPNPPSPETVFRIAKETFDTASDNYYSGGFCFTRKMLIKFADALYAATVQPSQQACLSDSDECERQ